jgi:hypothetical protein
MTELSEEPEEMDVLDVTSCGVPWSEVTEDVIHYVEWMDGRHGASQEPLPSADQEPIPPILYKLPQLHPKRPRGSKPMLDVSGAKKRLANCRPGAWLRSPYTGWQWAVWPNGEVGWVPRDIDLPNALRVSFRNGLQ